MILLYSVDLKLPAVTQKIVLSLYEIPLLLLLALSGTYVILYRYLNGLIVASG
jgi:hypothetical protein